MNYTVPLPDNKINQATRERIGEAVFLLAYFIQKADWETGKLVTTHSAISRETGFPEPTIKRWMDKLMEAGEIVTRRVRLGTLIILIDYAAVARTHGVKDWTPSVVPDSALSNRSEMDDRSFLDQSKMDHQQIISDTFKGSELDHQEIRNGLSNINKILSKTKKETILNSSPSSFVSLGDALPFGQGERKEADPYCYETADDRRKRLASEWLENATEQERVDMRRNALESIADDSRPFVRMFVRRNERGELAVAGNLGPEMLLARIGLLLEEAPSPPGESLPTHQPRPG